MKRRKENLSKWNIVFKGPIFNLGRSSDLSCEHNDENIFKVFISSERKYAKLRSVYFVIINMNAGKYVQLQFHMKFQANKPKLSKTSTVFFSSDKITWLYSKVCMEIEWIMFI